MTAREFTIVVHLLLLVYWLGADLGQFVASFWVRRPSLSIETRATLARLMVVLDVGPKICLVLMLPVGLTLAAMTWATPVRGTPLVVVWLASLVWLVAVVQLHFAEGRMGGLRRADMVLRAALGAGLVAVAVVSIVNGDPFAPDWLALKVGIFGVLVLLGLGVRIAIRDFGPAFGRLVSQGSSPDTEAALNAALLPAYPLVVAIWFFLIAAATIGVAKP